MSDADPYGLKGSFLWGAATSSHQIEGNNIHNDWWAWEADGNIEGGVRSGHSTDHWNRFREDLKLAADLGMNSYRFSIEWSRIEPEEGKWNQDAIDRYSELLGECEKLGLMPMLTLHHFTSPKWLAERGGFTDARVADSFERYTRKIIQTLGPRVPLWCTINEPMVLVSGTYLGKFMPPAVFSPQLASVASRNLLRCHVRAYDLIHCELKERKGPWKDVPIQVGIAHNLVDFMPDRKWHPLEQVLAKAFHGFYNRAWFDAITGRKQKFGIAGVIPAPDQVPEARGRLTCDYLGVNYYMKAYVQWRPRDQAPDQPKDVPIGLAFARRKEPASDMGWAVHPEGFRKMLRFASRFELPIYITENGMADRDDDLRPSYIHSHLLELSRAIHHDRIDVRGYYYWSLLDNFEWIKGYGPRFGMFHVDYETFERKKTHSASLYQRIIEAHRAPGGKGSLKAPDETLIVRQEIGR